MAEISTTNAENDAKISAENYAFLQDRIYRESGIVLDHTKQYLMEARLMPIVREEKLNTINDLCARLRRANGFSLGRTVVEAMTTNETFFFRDTPVFDRLRDSVLPAIVEKRKVSRCINIWSAAASTGQEAYSLAILLSELGLVDWKIRILGTDLNNRVLERARNGSYIQLEVNRGLSAKYLVKYFDRVGLEWKVKAELGRIVEFQSFDLRRSMNGFGSFDLVLCRNVLIYFDGKTKRQILTEIRSVLNTGSMLILGSAETTLGLDDKYARRADGPTVFYEAI